MRRFLRTTVISISKCRHSERGEESLFARSVESIVTMRRALLIEGWFGLQNPSDNDIVFFKDVSIQSLR
jgi:hypothetical protein